MLYQPSPMADRLLGVVIRQPVSIIKISVISLKNSEDGVTTSISKAMSPAVRASGMNVLSGGRLKRGQSAQSLNMVKEGEV